MFKVIAYAPPTPTPTPTYVPTPTPSPTPVQPTPTPTPTYVPAPFDPTSIASCSVWLKADALSLSNNDPVSVWSDSSGNGNHVYQDTVANQPVYKTNQVNGKPTIYCDGVNSFMSSSNDAIPIDTTFAVFNYTAGSIFQDYVGGVMLKGGNANEPAIYGYIDGTELIRYWAAHYYVDDQAMDSTSVIPLSDYYIGCCSYWYFKCDGNLGVGADHRFASGRRWGGNFAEVIGYSRELTPTERGLVMDYLNTKYAIY